MKMWLRLPSLPVAALLILSGCSSECTRTLQTELGATDPSLYAVESISHAEILGSDDEIMEKMRSASEGPVTMARAELQEDRLRLTVYFGAGCERHIFRLYGRREVAHEPNYPRPNVGHVFLHHEVVPPGVNICMADWAREEILEFEISDLIEAWTKEVSAAPYTIEIAVHGPNDLFASDETVGMNLHE